MTRLPYPGLRAFRHDETELFFGRDEIVKGMVTTIAKRRFLAVLGASGSGKSSVVRTGLIDALELGRLRGAGSRWRILDFSPGGSPMRNLAAQLAGEGASELEIELQRAFLMRGPRSLIEWCENGNLPEKTNLLVLVDQFEELFRYQDYAGRNEAEAFVALLLASARAETVPLYVAITMRSEYLGACTLIEGLVEEINRGQLLIPRMTRGECEEAVLGPAAVCGFEVEPALVNRLLNDLETFAPWEDRDSVDQLERLVRRADQLPLMQHALNRMWSLATADPSRRDSLLLGVADYDRIGGLKGTLNGQAKEILDELGEARRDVVEIVFRALTAGNSVTEAVRRPTTFGSLVALTGGREDDVRAVVEAFAAHGRNLLQIKTAGPLRAESLIDISHEALIRQWTLLSEWLEEEAKSAATWRRLQEAAAMERRGETEVLVGRALANEEEWWNRAKPTAVWAERYKDQALRYGVEFADVEDFYQRSLEADRARREAEAAREREMRESKLREAQQERALAEQARELAEERAVSARRIQRRTAIIASVAVLTALLAIFLGWQARNAAYEATLQTQRAEAATAKVRDALTMKEDERKRAERARADAVKAAEAADQERKRAVEAQGQAENAYNLALQTADQFLTGLADQLRRTPGVPSDTVEHLLADGEKFLDKFSGSVANETALADTRARVSLRFAEVNGDRNDLTAMRQRAQDGRRILLGKRQESDLSAKELALLGETYVVEGQALEYGNVGFSESLKLYEEADRLVSAARAMAPQDMTILLLAAKVKYQVGAANWNLNEYQRSVDAGESCLALLDAGGSAISGTLGQVARARCENVIGLGADDLGDDDKGRAFYERAAATIQAMPEQNWDTAAIRVYAVAKSNLGWLEQEKARFAEARELFAASAEAFGRLLEWNPRVAGTRDSYATALTNVARTFYLEKNYQSAFKKYREAHEARTHLPDRDDYKLINNSYLLLKDVFDTLAELVADDKDGALTRDYVSYLEEMLDVIGKLQLVDPETDRSEEILEWKRFLAYELRRLMVLSGEDRWPRVEKLLGEVMQTCHADFSAGNPTAFVKRACLLGAELYPDKSDDIPLVTEPAEQIAMLERARQQLDSFLDLDPKRDIWQIEEQLGSVSVELAQLYVAAARPQDALAAAEASAALYDRRGVELLAGWYETGSGPVLADAAKAARYRQLLASRVWSRRTFSAHRVDQLWTTKVEELDYDVTFFDPRYEGDNPLDRFLHQLEDYEGVRLPDDLNAGLKERWEYARTNKSSFLEVLVEFAGDSANVAEVVVRKLKILLTTDSSKDTGEYIASEVKKGGGVDYVEQALAIWLADLDPAAATGQRARLQGAGIYLEDNGYRNAAEIVFTALIDTAPGDPRNLADLHYHRAIVRDRKGDAAGAEADTLVAATLAPSDAEVLNFLGYNWLVANKNLPAATGLLERASALAPNDFFIKDSLGWAYVVGGDPQKGLPLLVAAAAAEPEMAEIAAHVADANRRLGQAEVAKSGFEAALALDPGVSVRAFILAQMALMGISPGRDIASAIERASFQPDPGISTDAVGIAIQGYDPVSYFRQQQPVKGLAKYFAIWEGAIWLFSSADDRTLFLANPDHYAPAYGGYCAYAAAVGNKRHADPEEWAVYDDKLYLHETADARAEWMKSPSKQIADANAKWPELVKTGIDPEPDHWVSQEIRKIQAASK